MIRRLQLAEASVSACMYPWSGTMYCSLMTVRIQPVFVDVDSADVSNVLRLPRRCRGIFHQLDLLMEHAPLVLQVREMVSVRQRYVARQRIIRERHRMPRTHERAVVL